MGVETEVRTPHTTIVCQPKEIKQSEELRSENGLSYTRHSNKFLIRYTSIGIMLVVLLSMFVGNTSAMPRALLCDRNTRCLHGGSLRLPDTPFGFCRCICTGHYVGPRCQFNRNNRIRRVNRLKRLVQMKLEFEQLLTAR